jgi:hypothetical protein
MNYYITLAYAMKQIKRGKRMLKRAAKTRGLRKICRTLKRGF